MLRVLLDSIRTLFKEYLSALRFVEFESVRSLTFGGSCTFLVIKIITVIVMMSVFLCNRDGFRSKLVSSGTSLKMKMFGEYRFRILRFQFAANFIFENNFKGMRRGQHLLRTCRCAQYFMDRQGLHFWMKSGFRKRNHCRSVQSLVLGWRRSIAGGTYFPISAF